MSILRIRASSTLFWSILRMPQLVVSALKASGSWYSPVRRRSFPIPPRKQVGKPVATYATVRYAYTIEYPDDLLLTDAL